MTGFPVRFFANFAVYGAFARVRFADLLSNRSRTAVGVLSYVIYISVFSSIYRAVYQSGGSFADFSLREALSYVSVAWLLRSFYINRLDEELTDEVRQGDIVLTLLRPVNWLAAKVVATVGEAAFRAVFFTLPTALVVTLLYDLQPPGTLKAGLYFFLSSVLALFVYTQLNLTVGLLAVFTEHTVGIQRAKRALLELFGGVLLPLSVFPDWAQTVLGFLPFQAVAYAPLQLYLTKAQPLTVFAAQGFWFFALSLGNRWLWSRAKRQLTVQGG